MPGALSSTTAEEAVRVLRDRYRDAVRLSAREEILTELATETVIARLHADTARFHHGSAHAYATALQLPTGEEVDVHQDKQQARWTTRETDVVAMRCQGRHYEAFNCDSL